MEDMEKQRRDPARIRFWVFIGLLSVTGVTMSFIAAFGFNDSVAFDIVWRVFLMLLYIVISFAAQHLWLRLVTWSAIGITFVIGLVNVFSRYLPFIPQRHGGSIYTWGDPSTGWDPWFGIEQDVEFAAHMICVGLLALGLLSLAWHWIAGQRILQGFYRAAFIFTLLSLVLGAVLIIDTRHRWNIFHTFDQLEAGVVILALTATVITVIGAFVQWRTLRTRSSQVSSRSSAHPVATGNLSAKLQSEGLGEVEIRALVRQYVDEYLSEKPR